MNADDFAHFVCIVAGENPEKLMEPYGVSNGDGNKHVLFKFNDAKKLQERQIELYQSLIEKAGLPAAYVASLKEELKDIKEMTPDDFFTTMTSEYKHDPDTGDAYTTENPNGKWRSYAMGKFFSVPFKTLNGEETFQARKKDIDWDSIHLNNQAVYKTAWETVMEGKEPKTEEDKIVYENMKNRKAYFEKYGDKKTYVISNTAFWGYAFLSEKEGWKELEPNVNQFIWVSQFFDRFIEPLDDNTLLTIYECVK